MIDPLTGQQARNLPEHWIFNGFPNEGLLGPSAPKGWKFPIVIIQFPDSNMESMSVNGNIQKIESTVTIECYAEDRDNGNTSGRRLSNQLADSCTNILSTVSRLDLLNAKLHGPYKIKKGSTEPEFIGARKYYSTKVDYEFRRSD